MRSLGPPVSSVLVTVLPRCWPRQKSSYNSSADLVWILRLDGEIRSHTRFADWWWSMKSGEKLNKYNWPITNVSSKPTRVGLNIEHSPKVWSLSQHCRAVQYLHYCRWPSLNPHGCSIREDSNMDGSSKISPLNMSSWHGLCDTNISPAFIFSIHLHLCLHAAVTSSV